MNEEIMEQVEETEKTETRSASSATPTRPTINSKLRHNILRMPEVIREASGIVIYGKRIKSLAFTTDLAIIKNCDADAVFAVYPFTPQQSISDAIIKHSSMPVFCGIGGGTTNMATFKHGYPVAFSSIGVGGNNVTNDIAWGLTTSFTHAERLKTLHGCAFMTSQDKEDLINVYPVGEEDDSLIKQVPKAELISIITPRIEEIFELVNKKLAEHGLRDISSHRVVLTGGGAQLSGIRDIANMVLDKQVRIGRPKNVINLPDNLYNPCFSTAIGLLLFALNYSEKKPNKIISKPASSGTSFGRILDWLKQSF